jgi:hypothetical protein
VSKKVISIRQGVIEALLGLSVAEALHESLDASVWRAYESAEEKWIHERYALLVDQAPSAAAPAKLDMQLKLTDLRRRAIQFRFLVQKDPDQLRGGAWQLSWLPFSEKDRRACAARNADYRKCDQQVRDLSQALRSHPEHENFLRAQTQLWKTLAYREGHRRYSSHMQELTEAYARTRPALSEVDAA